jgi:hypothetical protein
MGTELTNPDCSVTQCSSGWGQGNPNGLARGTLVIEKEVAFFLAFLS